MFGLMNGRFMLLQEIDRKNRRNKTNGVDRLALLVPSEAHDEKWNPTH